MYVAVLIGFVYGGGDDEIGCVAIDLYRVYRFCLKRDAMCFVLTDMPPGKQPAAIETAILTNKIDSDAIRFAPGYPEPLPRLQFHQVESLKDLVFTLETLELKEEPRVFFYYSGHGCRLSSQIRMPSGEQLHFAQIRHALLSSCWEMAEVFLLVDCCGSGSWGMPYKLDLPSQLFRLLVPELSSADKIPLPLPSTILISSTLDGQTALGAREGSYFTNLLLKTLEDGPGCLNLTLLLRQIKIAQDQALGYKGIAEMPTAAAYSSYPIPAVVWPWLLFPGVTQLRADPTTLCVIFEGS